jgi:hypothetical protein
VALRWYITQIDPDSAMASTMSVNSSAIIDQPPSTLGPMCRKKIMCTTICVAANAMMTSAVIR